MNHNNVISLPVYDASSSGDLLALRSDGTVMSMRDGIEKEKVIGVALHDVDPYEIGDPHAIHLFSGIFSAQADASSTEINIGDVVGIVSNEPRLKNTGILRQVGLAMDALAEGTGLIRVIST